MSGTERFLSRSVLRPSALNGNLSSTPRLAFGFTPIASVPSPNQFIPQTVRPVPSGSGIGNTSVTTTTGGSNGLVFNTGPPGANAAHTSPQGVGATYTSTSPPFQSATHTTPQGVGGTNGVVSQTSVQHRPRRMLPGGDGTCLDVTSSSRSCKRKPLFYNSSPADYSQSTSAPLSDEGMSLEPQRKLHLSEDFVAQTMSELYISPPTCKVAKRDMNRDVAEAINLAGLEELESKFSNQAINDDVILPQRLRRTRKLPCRQRQPQLRLTLHQDLKNVKAGVGVLPEALISRYRPSARAGNSTALVLWKPPGGFLPDLISNALRGGAARGGRLRCYSEVTSTPYSSHENLVCGEDDDVNMLLGRSSSAQHSPLSAEAPELSTSPQSEDEILPSVGLQRRNSAPEISEPLQYMDDDRCMEL